LNHFFQGAAVVAGLAMGLKCLPALFGLEFLFACVQQQALGCVGGLNIEIPVNDHDGLLYGLDGRMPKLSAVFFGLFCVFDDL